MRDQIGSEPAPESGAGDGGNIYDRLVSLIGRVAGYSCLVASVLLLVYEVVARYVFNAPTKFSLEYGLICQVLIAALSSAYVLQKGGHVGIDVIAERLPLRYKIKLTLVNHICGALFCLLLGWIMLRAALFSWKMDNLTETMEFPIAPIQFLVVAGLVLLSGQFVNQALKILRGLQP